MRAVGSLSPCSVLGNPEQLGLAFGPCSKFFQILLMVFIVIISILEWLWLKKNCGAVGKTSGRWRKHVTHVKEASFIYMDMRKTQVFNKTRIFGLL